MISCKRAAELISLSREAPLGWRRRLALAFHLSFCAMCRRFCRQTELLDRAARAAGSDSPPAAASAEAASLPEAARERIKAALRRADSAEPPA
jgi:hypothetical protein